MAALIASCQSQLCTHDEPRMVFRIFILEISEKPELGAYGPQCFVIAFRISSRGIIILLDCLCRTRDANQQHTAAEQGGVPTIFSAASLTPFTMAPTPWRTGRGIDWPPRAP